MVVASDMYIIPTVSSLKGMLHQLDCANFFPLYWRKLTCTKFQKKIPNIPIHNTFVNIAQGAADKRLNVHITVIIFDVLSDTCWLSLEEW